MCRLNRISSFQLFPTSRELNALHKLRPIVLHVADFGPNFPNVYGAAVGLHHAGGNLARPATRPFAGRCFGCIIYARLYKRSADRIGAREWDIAGIAID